MKKLMKFAAGMLAALMLAVPALAENAARPNITAHKANGIEIDGKLDEWNLDSPAVVQDASQVIRDVVFWPGPTTAQPNSIWPGMKKTCIWPPT